MTVGTANNIDKLFVNEIAGKYITSQDTSKWTQEDWNKALADVQNEVANYFNNNFSPIMEEEELLTFIERFPRDPNNPQHLTRFTPEERRQRRATIEMFRDIATEFSFNLKENSTKYAAMRRPWTILLGTAGNQEIFNLFSSDGMPAPEYRQNKIDELLASDKSISPEDAEKQVDAALDARRVGIIMERLHASENVLNNLDALTDTSLPPETLAMNFYTILNASQYYMEAENFAKENSLPFSDEQREWIANAKQKLDIFQAARGKIAYMANPLYEYIDLNELDNFDISSIETAYENEKDNYEDRDIPKELVDNFDAALADLYDITMTRQIVVGDRAKEIAASYGLDVNATWGYEEGLGGMNKGGNSYGAQLANGNLLAIEQGSRAVILVPPKPGNMNVEILQRPSEYFNFFYSGKINALLEKRVSVDPGYIKGSPQFHAMHASLEALAAMGRLPDFPDDEAIARYRSQLQDVSRKCTDYLDYKQNPDSSLARRRVAFAKELNSFVNMKLEQLETVQKATDTLERYSNLAPDDFAQRVGEDRLSYIDEWRHTKPLEWTADHMREYQKLNSIPVVTYAMNDAYDALSKSSLESATAEQDTARLVGTMLISQIIKNEQDPVLKSTLTSLIKVKKNPAIPGDSDKLCDSVADALGETVILDIIGNATRDPQNLKNVLSEFDPIEMAERYKDNLYEKYDVQYSRELHTQYMQSIADLPEKAPAKYKNTLRDFTQNNILDLAQDIRRSAENNPLIGIEEEKVRTLTANCVIYGMISLERAAPENAAPGMLEQMLADPQKLGELRSTIMSNNKFDTLCKENFAADGELEYDQVKNLLASKKPLRTANSMLIESFAEKLQNNRQNPQQVRKIDVPVKGAPVVGKGPIA